MEIVKGLSSQYATPKGVYLHIPFCLKKCAYCDFPSRALQSDQEMEDYFRALAAEIQMRAAGRALTIYFGGGTPSLASPGQIESTVNLLREYMSLSPQAEASLEVNPATLESEKLRLFRLAGINRLSLGIQSTQDKNLKLLARCHTAAQSRELFTQARQAGFANISCDLMYGLPNQSLPEFQQDLKTVLAWGPEHLSLYALSVEPQTPLAVQIQNQRWPAPDDDLAADMYIWARDFLGQQGYVQYELSNFCREGFACQHNLLYWKNKDYLGLGAAAHSYENSVRSWNEKDPGVYLEKIGQGQSAKSGEERLVGRKKVAEYIMLGLRLTEGVKQAEMQDMFGKEWEKEFSPALHSLQERGLLQEHNQSWLLTQSGMLFANVAMREIL